MPEDGRLVLTVGYIVNTVAVEEYETIAKTTVKYGMVAVLAEKLNGKAPLDETLDDDVRVVKAEISKEYSAFDFKVSGFTTELFDLELVMAMYVTEGDEYVYLQKDQTKLPESISINKVLQQ